MIFVAKDAVRIAGFWTVHPQTRQVGAHDVPIYIDNPRFDPVVAWRTFQTDEYRFFKGIAMRCQHLTILASRWPHRAELRAVVRRSWIAVAGYRLVMAPPDRGDRIPLRGMRATC
jgi:hypothetical protein